MISEEDILMFPEDVYTLGWIRVEKLLLKKKGRKSRVLAFYIRSVPHEVFQN